jgi:hypothetical protein
MTMLVKLVDRIAQFALGSVEAGACVGDFGCCCNAARTLVVGCDGTCHRVSNHQCQTTGRCA